MNKHGIVRNPVPYLVDHNLSITVFNVLYYEIFLMFEPQSIKIDPLRLMSLRGNALTKCYVFPCGQTLNNYNRLEKNHLVHQKDSNTYVSIAEQQEELLLEADGIEHILPNGKARKFAHKMATLNFIREGRSQYYQKREVMPHSLSDPPKFKRVFDADFIEKVWLPFVPE